MKEYTTRPVLITEIESIQPFSKNVFNVRMKDGSMFTCDELIFQGEMAIVKQEKFYYSSFDPM